MSDTATNSNQAAAPAVQGVVRPRRPGMYKFICDKDFRLGGPDTVFVGTVFRNYRGDWCYFGTHGKFQTDAGYGCFSGFSWSLKDFIGNGRFIRV